MAEKWIKIVICCVIATIISKKYLENRKIAFFV